MSKARPYRSARADELRSLFESSRSNVEVLRALDYEMSFRDKPKARKLAAEIQQALRAALSGVLPIKPVTKPAQASLIDERVLDESTRERAKTSPAEPSPATPGTNPVAPSLKDEFNDESVKTAALTPEEDPPVPESLIPPTVEAAAKLLSVTASGRWETIEAVRQRLVRQSSPVKLKNATPETQRAAREQAASVNAAHQVLFDYRGTRT